VVCGDTGCDCTGAIEKIEKLLLRAKAQKRQKGLFFFVFISF
jgi:hypothetical protein